MTASQTIRHDRDLLVLGATGKVGSRVAARLERDGFAVRRGSRQATPPFDWHRPDTWRTVLDGTAAAFVSFQPDIGAPSAADTLGAFAEAARQAGVERLVVLSGRGEPGAAHSEDVIRAAEVPCTVLRCSWFDQNFSEHYLLGPVLDGVIALPVGDVTEPFVDLEDVADVALLTLTRPGHAGATYELTGPEALSFSDAAAVLSEAAGRRIRSVTVSSQEYLSGAIAAGVPTEEAHALVELFATVLDGRNSHTTPDIERLLGRPAGTFAAYAERTASTGVWSN